MKKYFTLLIITSFFLVIFASTSFAEDLTLSAPKITVLSNNLNALRVNWDIVDGADYYNVFRSENKNENFVRLASVKNIYYIDRTVSKNTTYYYRVLAVKYSDKERITSKSSNVFMQAMVDLTKPQIAAKTIDNLKVEVSWENDNKADYYNVYRKQNTNSYKLIGISHSGVYYDEELLEIDSEYLYRVNAVKVIGGKEYLSKKSNIKRFIPKANWQQSLKADNKWAYFLINKQNYLIDGYSVEMAEVNNSKLIDERCVEYARNMFNDAAKEGIYLTVISGYRSLETQRYNLNIFTERFVADGYSRQTAYDKAIMEIAPPGASEHNAALALDILPSNNLTLSQNFDQTKEFKWLYENSWKYGFILRYPKGKTNITGYIYEPWHYRFIGKYHAKRIFESELCLEEYMKIN